jgi:hypothetical protein
MDNSGPDQLEHPQSGRIIEQKRRCRLHQRAAGDQPGEPADEVRREVALRMGDQGPVAPLTQPRNSFI